MIVEHITYNQIEGYYDSSIFTAEKHGKSFEDAFPATKAVQDYVYTDGTADKSVERKFVEELDGSDEVNVYAKLPKGFSIPTPVGHYSPDLGDRVPRRQRAPYLLCGRNERHHGQPEPASH